MLFGKHLFYCIGVLMLLNVIDDARLSAGSSTENSITIVYNNIRGDTAVDVQAAGGFSAVVMFKHKKILFDVGGDINVLTHNIKALNIDTQELDAVVISHNHWDHVYGLPAVRAFTNARVRISVPASSVEAILQQNPRLDVVPVDEPVEILPGAWSSGEIMTVYQETALSEQALILAHNDGLYVVMGCAHPGVVEMVQQVKKIFPGRPIRLLAGGFHLGDAAEQEIRDISSRLEQLDVEKIAPSHCTGNVAMDIFKEEWEDRYLELFLGDVYKF